MARTKSTSERIYTDKLTLLCTSEEKEVLKNYAKKEGKSLSHYLRERLFDDNNASKSKQNTREKFRLKREIERACEVIQNVSFAHKSTTEALKSALQELDVKSAASYMSRLFVGSINELTQLNEQCEKLITGLDSLGQTAEKYNLKPINMQKITVFGVVSTAPKSIKSKSGKDLVTFSLKTLGSNRIASLSRKESVYTIYSFDMDYLDKIQEGDAAVVFGDFEVSEYVSRKTGEKLFSLRVYAQEIETNNFQSFVANEAE